MNGVEPKCVLLLRSAALIQAAATLLLRARSGVRRQILTGCKSAGVDTCVVIGFARRQVHLHANQMCMAVYAKNLLV